MAGADVIEAAIGVSLLVIVGYTLVSSILASGVIVTSAQQDMTMQNEGRMGTSIQISNEQLLGFEPNHYFTFDLANTGSEIIGNFSQMDMFITNSQLSGSVPVYCSYIGVPNTQGVVSSYTWGYMTITPDQIHPKMLDPGETMGVQIFIGSHDHSTIYIIVTTPNGISAAGNT